MDVLDSEDLFCLIIGSGFHLGTGKSIGLLGRVPGGLLTFGDFGHAEETGDTSLGLVGCVGERIPWRGLWWGGDIISVLIELVGERMSGIGTLGDRISALSGTRDGLGGATTLKDCGKDTIVEGGLLGLVTGIGDGEGEREDEGEPYWGEGDFGHSKGQSGNGEGVSLSGLSS